MAGTRGAVKAPPLILPNQERQVSDAGLVAVEYVWRKTQRNDRRSSGSGSWHVALPGSRPEDVR